MVPRLAIAVVLASAAAFSAQAHDDERIDQLEQEIQELKQRLSELEAKPRAEVEEKAPVVVKEAPESEDAESVAGGDGWKYVDNWRKLGIGMSSLQVKNILGEPHRRKGAKNSVWFYNNGGIVWITDGNVDVWSEPE